MLRPDVQTVTYEQVAGIYSAHDEIVRRAQTREACWLSGGEIVGYPDVTPTQLVVTGGIVRVDGVRTVVADQTLPDLNTGGRIDASLPRWILVEIDAFGTVQLVLGTPATDPLVPMPLAGRPAAGAIYVRAADTRQSIAQSIGTVNVRVVDLRQFIVSTDDVYDIRDWGDIVTDPSLWQTAFDNVRDMPTGGTLIIPPLPVGQSWPIEPELIVYSNTELVGHGRLSMLKVPDDVDGNLPVFQLYQDSDVERVKFFNFALDGNRYERPHGWGDIAIGAGIALGGDPEFCRRDITLDTLWIYRTPFYPIGIQSPAYKERIKIVHQYWENVGSDGIDTKTSIWGDHDLYIDDITVNGFGFQDDGSAAGVDLRGEWQGGNIRVPFICRPQHAGMRYRAGYYDGSVTRFGAMHSTLSNVQVGLCGIQVVNGITQQGTGSTVVPVQQPGNVVRSVSFKRGVPMPMFAYGNSVDANSYTISEAQITGQDNDFMDTALANIFPAGAGLPPWRVYEIAVANRLAAGGGGTVPNIPVVTGFGLTWVLEETAVTSTGRLSLFRACSSFDVRDALDWTTPDTTTSPGFVGPTAPATPPVSGPATLGPVTISFATNNVTGGATNQIQERCMAGGVVWDGVSLLYGKQDTDGSGTWDVDYGIHGADAYRQSVPLNTATTSAPSITMGAFDGPWTDDDENAVLNVVSGWFFNQNNLSQVLTPTNGFFKVMEIFSKTAGTPGTNDGRVLTMLYRFDTSANPAGTIAGGGTTFAMIGCEMRVGTTSNARP